MFRPPPGKMCWTYLKILVRKLFAPGVPSWLWACILNNERQKGMGRRQPWKSLTFSYQIFSKKVVFFVSSRKNKISSFLASPRKILRFTWKNYYCPPWITFSDPHVHNNWLIMDNWWNIVLWSGLTKGWCNRLRKQCRCICTEVFPWLTHQNLDYPEKFWCNVRIGRGIAPCGYASGLSPPKPPVPTGLCWTQTSWQVMQRDSDCW